MNRGIKVLQTSALPLGYVAASLLSNGRRLLRPPDDIELAIRIRLELTTSSVTGWHSNQLNYRAIAIMMVVGLQGLEPRTNRL